MKDTKNLFVNAGGPGICNIFVRPSDNFCESILCTFVESTSYPWWDFSNTKRVPSNDPLFDGAPDMMDYVSTEVTEVDEDWEPQSGPYLIDYDKIREGLRKLLSGDVKISPNMREHLAVCIVSDDADIDSDMTDCIIQAACFGELRYS